MQSPFPQDMDFTAQLDVLNEYIPVIDQIIDTNLSVDFYQKNRNLASLILQKCLAELKELKGTVASQEDVLQRATEELINLREENSHLNETNNNLINQVSNLKIFLNEADLIACSLRSELNQLKHENHILTDHYKRFDSSNEVNSYMQIDQIVPEKEQSLNGILVDKDLEESLLSEVLQQKEDTIKCLTQNIQDLSEYKEKYLKIQQENESYKTLEEQNKKLIEELLILKEDNKKLLNKSSAEIFKRLKPLEGYQNPEKGTTLQSEDEMVQNFSSITDEGCRNKNYLALKSFTIASPSKENVDIKKSNLLMETILLSSANRSKTPLMKRSNDRSKKQISSSQTLKKIQGLNLGSVLKKNNGKTTETALIEGSSKETEHKTEEFEIKQPKIDKESCSSLHVFADNKSSQRDRLNYSARKFEERANCQESPFDGNTSKASDEHCFDEMLSWEEGDFPRLNCSSLICHSPKMEYNLNTYQDTLKQQESQVIKDDDGRNQKLDSMASGESQKILEKIKNGQKNFQSEMLLKSTRIQSMFKENATQTDFIENQSIKGINDIKLKLVTPNRSKIISNGFVLLVSLLFSLIIISFFTKRIDKIETSL